LAVPHSPFQQRLQFDISAKYKELFNQYRQYSMLPEVRYMENLQLIDFFQNRTKGDLVECGTWRGGMACGMMDIAGPPRHYHFFDSFQGLPPARKVDGEAAIAYQRDTSSPRYFDNCRAEEEAFRRLILARGVPASQIHIYPGWFQDTLNSFPPDRTIGILRLDCDWYDSVMQCLNALYKRVESGAVIIVDDYDDWDGCARAVHDFLHACSDPLRVYRTAGSMVTYLVKGLA
jgi:hypothetical protein